MKTKGLRFFSVLGTLAILFSLGVTGAGATGGGQNPALNLSHVECVKEGPHAGEIEVHFVLVHSGNNGTPGNVVFGWQPFGSASPGPHTGSTWHFSAYYPSGTTINLSWAYVTVPSNWPGPSIVTAGNSINDYNGTYDCTPEEWGSYFYSEADCEAWAVFEQITLNGEDYGDPVLVDSGLWTDPLDDDEVAYSHDLTIEEPDGCHEITVRYYDDPDCEGWVVYEQTVVDGEDYGDPVLVDSGLWTDPLEQEDVESHGLTILEPADCHEVTVRYYDDPTCEGWEVYEQTVVDGQDYGDPVLVDSGLWTDPLTQETAYSHDLTIEEPVDCYDVTFRYYSESDCDGWEVYEQTVVDGQDYGDPVLVDSGLWTDPLTQETAYSHDLTILEPEGCQEVTVRYFSEEDCDGWTVYEQTVVDGRDYGDPVIVDQGAWTDPYTLETAQSHGLVINEPRDCVPEGEFTIETASSCEGTDAMIYDTIVWAPYNTEGELSVLWFYPNGHAFVTGETPLGNVSLTPGMNVFSASLTKEELIAAIGENNLTGGNPENDVNYDRLDLYTYVVILRIGSEELELTSNAAPLWGSCDRPERERPRCPECGAPVWESSHDGMALVWFSTTPCVIDWENWCIVLTETVRAWSQYRFFVEIRGEVLPATESVGADGNTWYVLEFDPGDGNFILWGADGQGDRFRNYGPVYKYSACSVAPGWQDTTAEGFLIVRAGMNRSDIIEFLIRETDSFFVGAENRGDLAIEWVNSHLPEGPLVVGTLMELPPQQ